ncbi:hypothetical protein Kpol_1035p21 [Vanderwaltozyma polyspora DSM 70294]|uniref:Uncharacterized protein n=1 Tax=Vanderwaltozyma polyspora (strain ATCC 22028 / DSM 70294 / BCRC 21397 / CBS 2163 / NBRC 10782 / NRRL Y-8283 / UCD 57-17) TaxID=436907 RepID=A7TKI6_VANPO|nr:uncharacterized protein Kpol_1035p21 [Vanderwaltozyma polyspora DSM 70294]EDO17208.1 hypothetical protein Kpol_1035p21 [Vanderwaltozyma polyspora DSM 70294]
MSGYRDTISRLPYQLFGSIVSWTCGSLSITLSVKFSENRAVLIIVACSTLLYGFLNLSHMIFRNGNMNGFHHYYKVVCLLLQALTFGSAVQYYKGSLVDSNITNIHKHIIVAFNSTLLLSLFVNGWSMGINVSNDYKEEASIDTSIDVKIPIDSNETYKSSEKKTVPVKHSSQTLTPDMDIYNGHFQNYSNEIHEDWVNQEPNDVTVSGAVTFPSVIRHRIDSFQASNNAHHQQHMEEKTKKKIKFKIFNSKSDKLTPVISSFKAKKFSFEKSKRSQIHKTNNENLKKFNSKYITRLSIISDFQKSITNNNEESTGQLQDEIFDHLQNERSLSMALESLHQIKDNNEVTDQKHVKPSSSRLEIEKNAIERINSALLPPILSPSETPKILQPAFQLSEGDNIPLADISPIRHDQMEPLTRINTDLMEAHDLESIPQIPTVEENTPEEYLNNDNLPQTVTLDVWNNTKEDILKRGEKIQSAITEKQNSLEQSNLEYLGNTLASPLESSSDFSFPFNEKKLHLESKPRLIREPSDDISLLEEYFNDVSLREDNIEDQLFENGFNQSHSNSMIIHDRASKELSRIDSRHSPTKSIVSIISATNSHNRHKSPHNFTNILANATHMRANSHLSNFNTSFDNSSCVNSPPSSPTRSIKLKNLGKRLSTSNISDTFIPTFNTELHSNQYSDSFFSLNHSKRRGKSIDFSYVHNLQNKSSPPKSNIIRTSSLNGSPKQQKRSKSFVMDKALKGTNSLFTLQPNSTRDFTFTSTIMEQTSTAPVSPRASSSGSSLLSLGSETEYPEAIVSEYDHERWNTLLSLQMATNQ